MTVNLSSFEAKAGVHMATKLIIDTDPGVDDAFALALAALSADVELLGVTTVFGNVGLPTTTRNARRLLTLCRRADVPVAAGAARPLVHPHPQQSGEVHGSDGLSGHSTALPEPERELEPVPATALLAQLLDAADEPVTVAAIGPLTNIAALLAAYPKAAAKIRRIVVMGGALGAGNVTPAAEFNIFSDPEAAQRVFTSGELPCVLVPLDLTHRCAVSAEWLDTLAASGPIGAALHALTPDYREHYRRILGWDGIVVHDAVALAEAIQPGILRTESWPLSVETSFGPARGATIADRRSAARDTEPGRTGMSPRVDVAVDTDLEELREFLLHRLAQ